MEVVQMAGKLEGKVCLVTGASSGLGKGVAKLFAQEGGILCLSSFGHQEGRDTVKEIVAMDLPKPFNMVVDLTRRDEVKAQIDAIVTKYGRIDVVANIACATDYLRTLTKCTPKVWDFMINGGLSIIYNVAYECIPHMQKQHYGVFVNCASIAAKTGYGGGAAYIAAKHGVIGLGKAIAAEYITDGIRCNTICPGGMDTPMADKAFMTHKDEETGEQCSADWLQRSMPYLNRHLAERGVRGNANVAEIAPIFLFFACDDSKWITGQDVISAGGFVMPQ
jgi:NAD(P)-dependent dehydrogenase (short-subunit alcohol dehydrogenase family)